MELGNLVEERLSERASYRRYESGIHEITFHEPSRLAADEFIVHLSYMYDQHLETDEPYFLLVDAGENVQIPLRYVFQRGREINRTKYPTVPQGGRSVYVFQKTFLVTVLDAFLRIARPQVSRRYLEPHQKQEAIDWLLEGIEERQKEREEEETRHAKNVALFTTDLPTAPKTSANEASDVQQPESDKSSDEKASDITTPVSDNSADSTITDYSAFTEATDATAETVKNESIATDEASTDAKSKQEAMVGEPSEDSNNNEESAAD